jgi:1,4-alpha-glucan branching enzyme
MLLFVCNFTPQSHNDYRIGAPIGTTYTELFNTDHEKYGGSNVLNSEPIPYEAIPWHNKPYSIKLRIPPLSTIILRPDM